MTVRVLYLIDTLEVGGAEKSLLEVLPKLRGMRPVVCHLYPGRALRAAYERAGVAVISLDLPGKYSFLRAVRATRQVVREHRPDVIHSTLRRADFVARAVGALERLPVVNSLVSDHYSPRQGCSRGRALRAKQLAFRLLDRGTARWVAAFAANSEAVRTSSTRALGIPAWKIRVIHRGRDAAVFHPPASQMKEMTAGAADGGTIQLVSIGRLREGKGHADLIQAMPTVLAQVPGALLTIAGEGPDREALAGLIGKLGLDGRVLLPGTSGDVPALLRRAHLFVSASRAEGFPGAVVEAMLTALPIALSDIAAHREMIEDGASGRLFVAGDVAALAAAILPLLQRPEVAQRLGRHAREHALARFSLERAVELHERLYEDVVGCRGGRPRARG